MQAWKFHQYARLLTISCMILVLLLMGFQSVWVLGGSASGIMLQTGLQRTRAQAIAKNALILAYRPQTEHSVAISELQNIQPLWEKTEKGLLQGDASLKLPVNKPDEVTQLVWQEQPDFLAMDTALKKILQKPDAPADPIQVEIILDHQPKYSLTLASTTAAWQRRIDDAFLHLFWIESAFSIIVFGLLTTIFVLRQVEHKNKNLYIQDDVQMEGNTNV
jgi:hypothetical protein